MKKPLLKILAQWGLALVLVLLLLIFGDISQFRRLPEIHWRFVLLGFLANVGFTLSHNFRWKEIVENISSPGKVSFFSLYRYLTDSYAVGKIIPMDASLLGMRSYYLSRSQGLPLSMAIFSVVLDRFLDVVIFLVLALPSFLVISGAASVFTSFFVLALLLIGQFLFIFWKKGETFHFFLKVYGALISRWFSKVPFLRNRLSGGVMETGVDSHFSRGSVIRTMNWNFVKYLFLCLRFYYTGLALGIRLPLVKSFFFIPFVQLSGFVNVTPGGLGIVEMGTYGALFLMGIPKTQILLFVLGQRILLFSMFLGLFVMNRLLGLVQYRWGKVKSPAWRG